MTPDRSKVKLSRGRFSTRRAAFLIASALAAFIIAFALYFHWKFVTYPEHAVTNFTGIQYYQTLQKVHSDYDWYIRVNVRPSDSERLLARYPFQTGFSRKVLQGRIDGQHVADCPECWSYFESKGHGIYGYILLVLSADKKQLQMYEFFGD